MTRQIEKSGFVFFENGGDWKANRGLIEISIENCDIDREQGIDWCWTIQVNRYGTDDARFLKFSQGRSSFADALEESTDFANNQLKGAMKSEIQAYRDRADHLEKTLSDLEVAA
jgi:hypothetical protein